MKSFGKNFVYKLLLAASVSAQDADSVANELLGVKEEQNASTVKRNEIVRKQQLFLQIKIQLSELSKKLDAGIVENVSDDIKPEVMDF